MKRKHLFWFVFLIAVCYAVLLILSNSETNSEKIKPNSLVSTNDSGSAHSDTAIYGRISIADVKKLFNQQSGNTETLHPFLLVSDSAAVRVIINNKGEKYVLPGRGKYDIVALKYDLEGNIQWFITAGGKGNDRALGALFDTVNCCVYICGSFSDTAYFAGEQRISLGGTDVFISKWDYNANLLWVISGGSPGNDYANRMELLNDLIPGHSYINIVGKCDGMIRFDEVVLTNPPNNSAQNKNVFTVACSTDGASIPLAGFRWFIE
ncbi:MAG: hypothetical protein MUD00_00025 [Candidatus Pacebacteria bacterium]|jgi:hypothetical protein|nr:hypothetical protein [Candidatus Paceibacterota bacterium]